MSDNRRSLNSVDDIEFAVRRIDELEADLRKMVLNYIAAEGQAAEAYQAQLAAEAKLAKAVEALDDDRVYGVITHTSLTTLTELKGEDRG